MSYYSHPDSTSSYPSSASSTATAELRLYQAFIFSVPIFFTFILLFLFYLFYLRSRRVDWASLRMRSSLQNNNLDDFSRAEMGLKKELREMLPIIIYKESFSIKDTQCSVCLTDYQAEDKLQQIPSCGHAFHMDCIDHWLATHTTCPLCRLSLIPPAKAPIESPDIQEETNRESSMENTDGASDQPITEVCAETHSSEHPESRNGNAEAVENNYEEEETSQSVDQGSEFLDSKNETKEDDHSRQIAA